jgi:serine/threonine protein kinase
MIGQTVSHYRILEKLGGGGMGVVYRAHDERLDRDVALKVLSAGLFSDETARSRFRREALTLSHLNHPNVAVVYDFDSENGADFLTMEYVEGETLAARTAAGPLAEAEIINLGTQIAEALEEAHERQIIHRDLKPANVMVTSKGRAKVLDFGLAKMVRPREVDAATASLAESQPGVVVGTVPYMAPEQLQGKVVDSRADVYALGAILYEMATGQRPFPERQSTPLIASILTEPPQPPRELNGQVSPGLEAIILKTLEKNPDERYQSAKQVLEDLGRLSVPGSVVAAQKPKIQSIAVLPLANLSGDPQQEYFADGMTEELITNLAKISALKVISRTSMMQYKGTKKSLPQIAKELNVDALIEGSVLREGGQVRITAQLIQASTDQHLWAESYQRDLHGVLALQSEIASAIGGKVRAVLTPSERARLAHARTVNPEAYEAYLKGKFYLNKMTSEGFEKGLAYLKQAIEIDPADPLPYAGLALGYSLIGHEAIPDNLIPAKAAALKALELDPNLLEAHEALAEIKLYWDWDWTGAQEAFEGLLAQNPNLPEVHAHFSWYLELMKRVDEAHAEMKRAAALDPLTPLWPAWQGWQYWKTGEYDRTIDGARKALELNPDFPWGLYVLGVGYAEKGMFEEAIAVHQKAAAISPTVKWALGYTYALASRREEAQKIAAELIKQPMPMETWGLAEIYTALGDKDEAFRWLEECAALRFTWMPWITNEPPFKPLRSDPRFQDLVRRMNLPQ